MPQTIRTFIRTSGTQTMREGDVFITNDPWYGSGHLNDASIVAPIFQDGRVIGFAGVVSHLPDVGGRLGNPANRELCEEGLRVPPLRLLTGGREAPTLIAMIRQRAIR